MLRRSTAVVYHSDRKALSTACVRQAGLLATADTCYRLREQAILCDRSYCAME